MNKIVIVTGAAQGMGLGIAKHFLEKKNMQGTLQVQKILLNTH